MSLKNRFTSWLRLCRRSMKSQRPRLRCCPTLEALENRTVLTAAFNQTFVATLYQGVLHRNAEAGGLNYWAGQIMSGMSKTSVADQIYNSPEAHAQNIQQDYEKLLGRNADSGGEQFWQGAIQGGATLEQVQANIAGSDEFFQKAGGTNDGFLKSLYKDFLGRSPDAAGQVYFGDKLQQGTSRSDVADEVTQSAEAEKNVVAEDYQQILGHPVDSVGLDYWTPKVVNLRQHQEDVAAGIAGSAEYSTAIEQYLPSVSTDDPNVAAHAIIQDKGLFEEQSTPPPSNNAVIYLQPAPGPLTINTTAGNTNASGTLTINNKGTALLNYQVSGTVTGPNGSSINLNFDRPTGAIAAGLSQPEKVSLNASSLPAGTYTGTITVTDTSGAAGSATEQVKVTVADSANSVAGTYTGSYKGSAQDRNNYSFNVSGTLKVNITSATRQGAGSTYSITGTLEADNFFGQNISGSIKTGAFDPTNSMTVNDGFSTVKSGIVTHSDLSTFPVYVEIISGQVTQANGKYSITGTVSIGDSRSDTLQPGYRTTNFTINQN